MTIDEVRTLMLGWRPGFYWVEGHIFRGDSEVGENIRKLFLALLDVYTASRSFDEDDILDAEIKVERILESM